ncbi:LPS-assembly protein LptD [Roseateles sp. BYS180W]|uniref:LPS-assembly protein LptD n=1 Tax=Roseateles rivi TaxID=3299028 RepID=A0ABW7FT97_9BURK
MNRPNPLAPVAHAVLLCLLAGASQAQDVADLPPLKLKVAKTLGPSPRAAVVLSGTRLTGQIDQAAKLEGGAQLRQGDVTLNAALLTYDPTTDLARGEGGVELVQRGSMLRGPSLQLYVDRFEGVLEQPSYYFAQTGGSGRASQLRFLGQQRVRADDASYSTCPAPEDPQEEPAWVLRTSELKLDFELGEGVAKGAVLKFYGVPILAAPRLSFPISDEAKTGWLPPSFNTDSRSGVEFGVPYFIALAPNRDLTLEPYIMTRRGAGLDSEFRYLEPQHRGQMNVAWLPNDRQTGQTRWDLRLSQEGRVGDNWQYAMQGERVSDDDYWKDMRRRMKSLTPRLLNFDASTQGRYALAGGSLSAYGRVQRWQVLQGTDVADRFASPYQRSPQVGLRYLSANDDVVHSGYQPWGRSTRLEGGLELEYNRFDLPPERLSSQSLTGERVHMLGHASLPMSGAAWWLIPKVSFNAAAYRTDQLMANGRSDARRIIPSFSLDHGWVMERDTRLFDMDVRQILEPRVLYVNTAYRDQSQLPNFDAAQRDFNFDSVFAENPYAGVDRVADFHSVAFGATTRFIEDARGEEVLRLGLVQRYLLRDQRINADGVAQGSKFSDLMLLASSHLTRAVWADSSMQLNTGNGRVERSVLRMRYTPGGFRTISTAYRLARGQSEQLELAWQWPLFGQAPKATGGSNCAGAWYSAGRVQYSLRDRRFTDSVVGAEYDSGCWVLRIGMERQATGRAETNTRLMLQLELVGLSPLGSNALKVLRDNIPGYRPLKFGRSDTSLND